MGVTRADSLAFKFTNIFGNVMDYKEQGEERLRAIYAGQVRAMRLLPLSCPSCLSGHQVSRSANLEGWLLSSERDKPGSVPCGCCSAKSSLWRPSGVRL